MFVFEIDQEQRNAQRCDHWMTQRDWTHLQSFLLLLRPSNGLLTHDAPTPCTLIVLVFLAPIFFDGRLELGQLGLVLGPDFRDGDGSSCLFACISD